MSKKISIEETCDYLKEQVKNLEWCELASNIIDMEFLLTKKRSLKAKELKLLSMKLDIFEKEKVSRIPSSFNPEHFIDRNYEYYDDDSH